MSQGPDNWMVDASEPSSTDELVTPLHVGKYKLVRKLGAGGMGIVYEAIQENPSRPVAVKLMRQAVMTVEQKRRFERESQLLGSLAHPNIAQVYEAGTHKEGAIAIPFYSMELVADAKSVTTFAKDRELSRRDRIGLVIQICSAIQFAHDRTILHRDLKPTNILVGLDGAIKVIDLGVSRLMTDASIALTRADQLIGTLAYIPPEHLYGTQDTPTVLWDVYALGIVLYELVVGQLPYRLPTDSPMRAARELEKSVPTGPRTVDASITKDLEAVMLKAIAKDPAKRYESVGALKHDLESILAGGPVNASVSSPLARSWQNLREFAQKHRAVALLSVIVLWLAALFGTPLRNLVSMLDTAWPAFALTHLNHIPDEPMQRVQIVSLRSDLKETAVALGETSYDPAVIPSARPLLGKLVERLATAKPKAIALDYSFANPSLYDGVFLDRLKKAEELGIPIVTASVDWKYKGGPGVLSELAERHRVGMAGVAEIYGSNHGLITMMIDEVKGDEATFITHAIAAANGIPKDAKLFVDYQQTLQAQRSDTDRQQLARVALLQGGPTGDGFERGFASNIAEVPPDAVIEKSDTDFDLVMRMTDAELRTTFGDKLVFVGDRRPGRDAIVEVTPGRPIVGYQLNALVADQILTGQELRWTGQSSVLGLTLKTEFLVQIAAFVIIVGSGMLLRSWLQVVFAMICFAVVVILIPTMAYQSEGVIFRSPTALFALLLLLPSLYFTRRWSARGQV